MMSQIRKCFEGKKLRKCKLMGGAQPVFSSHRHVDQGHGPIDMVPRDALVSRVPILKKVWQRQQQPGRPRCLSALPRKQRPAVCPLGDPPSPPSLRTLGKGSLQ